MAEPLSALPQWPLINGVAWSFQSIQVKAFGVTYFGTTALNYSAELKPDDARGTPALPLAYTLGKGTLTADIEMLKNWSIDLIAKLGQGFMARPFDILAQFGETNVGFQTDTIIGARIIKVEDSHSDGVAKQKLTLQPTRILYNGLSPIPNGR